MLSAAIVAAVALLGLFVFFFLLKRTLRLFVRLALLGLLLLLALAGAGLWWWYGPEADEGRAPASDSAPQRPRPASNRAR